MDTPSWMQAAWFRVLAIVVAVIVAGYALLVPTSLLFLAIGSLECLGPGCTLATPAAVGGGAIGIVGGIGTAVVLVILAIRPGKALLITSLVGLALLPIALLIQGWSLSVLDEGRDVSADAQQLSFELDRAMQEVLVEVTGASSLQQPGILGPESGALPCDLPDGNPGYQAWSRLVFTSGSQIDAAGRQNVQSRFDETRERMITIPATIELTQTWEQEGSDAQWTVTASCQPLPQRSEESGTLPDDAQIEYRFNDASIPPEYHRSYTLLVDRNQATITVDSYGDLLFEETVPVSDAAWQALVDGYPTISGLTSPPEGTCTGDTSSAVEITASGQPILDLSASSCDRAAEVAGQLNEWIAPARALFAPMDELAPPSD